MRVDSKSFDTYEEAKKIRISNTDILPLWEEIQEKRKELVENSDAGVKVYEEMEEKKRVFLEEMGALDIKYKDYQTKVEGIHNEIKFIEDKISPLVREELDGKLDEFDHLSGIDKDEEGLFAKVLYLLDIWVDNYRKGEAKRLGKTEDGSIESPYVDKVEK